MSLPANILKLETGVFQNCSSLTTINIPNGITSIGDAFTNCTSLTSFTIPSSVLEFGHLTFSGCSNLHEVTYNGTHEQFNSIHILVEDEELSMDDVFASFNITVNFAGGTSMSITSQPSDFNGKVGTLATFNVRATGDGLIYKWFEYDGTNWSECDYSGHNTSTLRVYISCSKDGHKYGCEVTDAFGHSMTSNNATLTIDRVPLKINTQPVNFEGLAGETATFSVKAQGDELYYQWKTFTDGRWVNCSNNDGANTASLSIDITDACNGSKYHCVITDGYGNTTTTRDVTLTVKPPLFILSQPLDFSGTTGNTATFSIVADGDNLTYQWYEYNGDEWAALQTSSSNTSSLNMDILFSKNGYRYYCEIQDSFGNKLSSLPATLTVEPRALVILNQPTNYSGRLGDIAVFNIEAEGNGNLYYQWQEYKNNEWVNSTSTGNSTNTFKYRITQDSIGTKFKCIITDDANYLVSSSIVTIVREYLYDAPTISTQPTDYSGSIGDIAVFRIKAEGEGTLSYQWQEFKNNEWVNSTSTGNTTATFKVKITQNRIGQQFRCIVSNEEDNIVESNIVTIYDPNYNGGPIINTQPSDYLGAIGEVAVFRIKASGEGTLTYQWQEFKNNTWINSTSTGNSTSTFKVKISVAKFGQKYRCVVTDGDGIAVTSREVIIDRSYFYAGPNITTQPADFTGSIGDIAIFRIIAEGEGTLKYQWQECIDNEWVNSVWTGNTTSTLKVKINQARIGQQFRCIVTDGSGYKTTSREVTIESTYVYEGPAINTQPTNFTGYLEETAIFSIKAEGVGTLHYQWQELKNDEWVDSSWTGNKTATLKVKITTARFGQQFRCLVSDGAGLSTTSNTVSILRPYVYEGPTINTQPSNFTGSIDEIAVFSVKAAGEGTLKYQWQELKNNEWVNSSWTGNKTATLKVKITSARYGQQFRCLVSDGAGLSTTSNTVIIERASVYEGPTIKTQPANYTGVIDEIAVYSVKAEGEGTLHYQWQEFKNNEWVDSSWTGNKTATLKVKITQARNGSKYRCVVTDDYDLSVTSIEAYLKVVAVPVTEGFKNQIDLSDPNVLVEPVVSEPANEVVIVESDNVSAEETAVIEAEVVETEVVETVVEETASETEIVETVDEQVS